jgi:hypothetical protein
MVVYFWNLRQEDHEFEASLGYIGRPCLKTAPPKKSVVSSYTNNKQSEN